MKIHSEFFALKRSARWIAQLLNADDVSDGAFARVTFDGSREVLKATICPATNALFEVLLACHKRRTSVPEALPAVFKRHGELVKDTEGFVYTVWSVERLFEVGQEREMRVARLGKRSFGTLKPGYVRRTARLSEGDLPGLQRALQQEQKACASNGTWEGSAEIALVMSLRTTGELQKAFQFLLAFVNEHKMQLDLLTQGNILLNMFGEPCLCDPVCSPDRAEKATALIKGICVAALVPSELNGFQQVTFEPRSTLPLEETALAAMEDQLRKLGLQPLRFVWGGSEHLQFLQRKPPKQCVWQVPQAARHLRQDKYTQAFAS